jgi:hypothetical protein
MRTKTLLCLAALTAAGVATSMAQSNVYSLNVVGYYNRATIAHQYTMIANQFNTTNQTVHAVLPSVPDGTGILKWTGVAFAPNNYSSDFGWDDETITLVPGEGFFLKNNATTNFSLTFVGEVLQNTNTINFAANVYKLVSLFTPQAGLLQTTFGYPAGDGDSVLQWSGTAYAPANYSSDFGWDSEPSLAVGDGFFVKATGARTWTRSFSVQ